MSDEGEEAPATAGNGVPDPGDIAAQTKARWEEALMAYAKQTAANASLMAASVPFPMGFPPHYMLPPMMPYAGLPPFYPPPAVGREGGEAKANKTPSQDSATDDDSEEEDGGSKAVGRVAKPKRHLSRAASLPEKKAKPSRSGLGVKSKSQAALALLASTAGGVFPTSSTPGANYQDAWGQTGAAAAAAATTAATVSAGGSGGDSDLGFDHLNDAAALVGLDDRELKRQRRKQSNRESARRSRLRKQAECETLQRENKILKAEVIQLRGEKGELNAQIAILNAKLSLTGALGPLMPSGGPSAAGSLAAAGIATAIQPPPQDFAAIPPPELAVNGTKNKSKIEPKKEPK